MAPALPGYPGTNALPVNPGAADSFLGGSAGSNARLNPGSGVGLNPLLQGAAPAAPAPPAAAAPPPATVQNSGLGALPLAAGSTALAGSNSALADLLRGLYAQPQPAPAPPLPSLSAVQNTPTQIDFGQQAGQIVNTPTQSLSTGATTTLPYNAPITQQMLQTNEDAASGGFTYVGPDGEVHQFADGGVIPEVVVGMGLDSHMPYLFGEAGPETVVPKGKKLSDVKGKHGKMGAYAEGGAIGYAPDYEPKVFNPPDLSGIVTRGYNTPGVPLLPQVNALTGGGQSLIPSAQGFFNALPSERSAYSGFLQDEAGVQPNDVFEIMKKLAPQVTGIRTPRFAA